jgi:glycosyltransferase involved in cell wall biosynthesis
MAQLVSDPLTKVDDDGGNAAVRTSRTWGPCGVLIDPSEQAIGPGMADALQSVLTDRERYAALAANARGRVADFFEFGQTMSAYNRLYRELGGLAESTRRREPSLTKPGRRPLLEADITPSRPTVGQS